MKSVKVYEVLVLRDSRIEAGLGFCYDTRAVGVLELQTSHITCGDDDGEEMTRDQLDFKAPNTARR